MPSTGPSDLRCQATALRYAARLSPKLRIRAALIARARRLQQLAERFEQENRRRDADEGPAESPARRPP